MSNVEHPSHYNLGKIEVIAAIEDWGFGEPCLTDKYVYKRDFRRKKVK